MSRPVTSGDDIRLVELLDRVLDKGVVIAGDITISVADVDLIYLGLRVVLTSVDKADDIGLPLANQRKREAGYE